MNPSKQYRHAYIYIYTLYIQVGPWRSNCVSLQADQTIQTIYIRKYYIYMIIRRLHPRLHTQSYIYTWESFSQRKTIEDNNSNADQRLRKQTTESSSGQRHVHMRHHRKWPPAARLSQRRWPQLLEAEIQEHAFLTLIATEHVASRGFVTVQDHVEAAIAAAHRCAQHARRIFGISHVEAQAAEEICAPEGYWRFAVCCRHLDPSQTSAGLPQRLLDFSFRPGLLLRHFCKGAAREARGICKVLLSLRHAILHYIF